LVVKEGGEDVLRYDVGDARTGVRDAQVHVVVDQWRW